MTSALVSLTVDGAASSLEQIVVVQNVKYFNIICHRSYAYCSREFIQTILMQSIGTDRFEQNLKTDHYQDYTVCPFFHLF